jgi:DNA-binding MarR family transcriptional regulator
MNESRPYQDTINRFLKVINIFNAIYRRPNHFGISEPLYPSEIHTIETVGKNEGLNVTDLSDKLGVSKPAISQIINKLEKKSLVKKYKGNGNDKETLLRLTKKGRVAFDGHEEYHKNTDKEIIAAMKRMSREEYDAFENVMKKIEAYAKKLLTERS